MRGNNFQLIRNTKPILSDFGGVTLNNEVNNRLFEIPDVLFMIRKSQVKPWWAQVENSHLFDFELSRCLLDEIPDKLLLKMGG